MKTHSSRRTPAHTAGHDYSQDFGPDLGGVGRDGRGYSHPAAYERAPQVFGSQPGVPAGFLDAVQRFYTRYAQFSGRASRSEYWWVTLYLVLVAAALQALAATIGTSPTGESNAVGVLLGLILLAFWAGNIVPTIAVSVRRLHDVDLSGWFYLLGLVPFLGGLILLVLMLLPPKPQGARFDR